MPGPYGLLPTGFVPKPLTDIVAELESSYKAIFGTSVGSNPDGSIPAQKGMGQQIGILAEREALLWELGQAINSSDDPDNSEDASLDAICALTGTIRNPERASIATLTATGDPGTVLPKARVVSVRGANTRFDTDIAATLPAALALWLTATAYVVGTRIYNGATPSRVYLCISAGTSASGPSGTGSSILDGTVLWRYLGDGTSATDIPVTAETPGPFAALSGTLTEIQTPVGGWKGAINILDAIVGDNIESNAALRIRRENELQGAAKGALDAIRAAVLKVGEKTANPVTACVVFQNTTMFTDANGLPPKSVLALVLGGLDQLIWDALLATVDAGIETFGNTVGTSTDSAGNAIDEKFSRPSEIDIWIEVDVEKYDKGGFPLDGAIQIRDAILAKMTKWSFGQDVNPRQIAAPIMSVPGVLDTLAVRLGLTASPIFTTPIVITAMQIARFDSSRILVTLSDGTP